MWRLFYVWTNTFGKVYTLYIIVQRAEAQKAEEVLHSHSGKASSKKLVWTSIFPLATLACLIQMAFLLTQKS
jgi:hypothetical protein